MIQDFLNSKSPLLQNRQKNSDFSSLCHFFEAFDGNWENNEVKLALITTGENRNSRAEVARFTDMDKIRNALYKLCTGHWRGKIWDMGHIPQGASLEDTMYALKQVGQLLLKKDILPIIVGGSDLLTYAQYRSYDEIHEFMEVARVDSCFDLGSQPGPLTSDTHLNHMITKKPQKLLNYYHLAYQSYLVAPEEVELMSSKLLFECHRLSSVVGNINEAEPVFRCADMSSFDVKSIRLADAPGQVAGSPNGLSAREACILARYAGISNRMKSLGIFGYESSRDIYDQTAKLIAQMIWHFIEGYFARSTDKPFDDEKDYKRYLTIHQEEQLVFLKSKSTERWWMELPYLQNKEKKIYVACSKNDYLKALNGEILDRWLNTCRRYR